jgi:hypothetical protein
MYIYIYIYVYKYVIVVGVVFDVVVVGGVGVVGEHNEFLK